MSRGLLKNLTMSFTLLAAVTLGTSAVAKADSVQLRVPNDSAAIGTGPFANVNYVLVGNAINVTVTGIGPYTLFGNSGDMFGFNVVGNTTGLSITNLVNCTVGGTNQQISAFGSFEFTVGGNTPPGVSSFSFTVTRLGGFSTASQLFENNAAGYAFATHIFNPTGPANARSGFAGNGSSVPEPASMILLGTGLLGAAHRLRKRRSK